MTPGLAIDGIALVSAGCHRPADRKDSMRKKTKLGLLGAALSCAVLATATTSTFAWFTIAKAVQINHATITVNSSSQAIGASVTPLIPTGGDAVSTLGGTLNVATEAQITDCSSSFGREFYVPNGNTNTFKALSNAELTGKIFRFGLTVYNHPTTEATTVKISFNWNASAGDASSAVVHWLRVGIVQTKSSDYDLSKSISNPFEHAWVYESPSTNNRFVNASGSSNHIPESEISARNSFVTLFTSAATQRNHYVVSVWMEGTISPDQGVSHDDGRGGSFSLTTDIATL